MTKPRLNMGKERKVMLKITMPPNATKAEVKKYSKSWKSVAMAFAKLTGENPKKIKFYKESELQSPRDKEEKDE